MLFVRGGALGDFVLTLPVLAAMFATGRRVDVVCSPRFMPLVALCGEPGCAFDIDGIASQWTFGGRDPVGYATAVCFSEQRAAALPVGDVRYVASRPPEGVPAWAHFALAWPCDPGLVLGRRSAPGAPQPVGAPVVLAPGASAAEKTRPLPWWTGLERAVRAAGLRCVVIGGPLEPWAEYRPELPELIQLLSTASVFVGPDSGPGHLARRLGTPTFTVVTDPARASWVPHGAEALDGELAPEAVASQVARAARSTAR